MSFGQLSNPLPASLALESRHYSVRQRALSESRGGLVEVRSTPERRAVRRLVAVGDAVFVWLAVEGGGDLAHLAVQLGVPVLRRVPVVFDAVAVLVDAVGAVGAVVFLFGLGFVGEGLGKR